MTQVSGRSDQLAGAAPTTPDGVISALAFDPQAREAFLAAVAEYLETDEAQHIRETIALAESALPSVSAEVSAATRLRLADALDVAMILAESLRIDVVTLAAVLLAPLVDANALTAREVTQRLDKGLGDRVARAIGAIERFDALHRPAPLCGDRLLRQGRRSLPSAAKAAIGAARKTKMRCERCSSASRKILVSSW